MSALKNKRGLSKMEFYHAARELRENITLTLPRDFGLRDKIEKTKTADNLEVTVIEGYPRRLIVAFRQNITRLPRNLMMSVTAGNTIYPTIMEEAVERRRYQTEAIISCEQLLQEMRYCADVLPVKLEKFLPFAEAVTFEIKLLKGWRKSTNGLIKKIENKDVKKEGGL